MTERPEEKYNISLQGQTLSRPNQIRNYDYHNTDKESDSTMFSIRENTRKADNHKQDSVYHNQNYVRNKKTANEASNNSSNQSSLIGIDKYNHFQDSSNNNTVATPLKAATTSFKEGGSQNAYNFESKSTIQENSKKGEGETEDPELQSDLKGLEKNGNNVGDDEPIFPTIINKRDAFKNENSSLNHISQTSGSIKPLNFGKVSGGLSSKIELYNLEDTAFKNYKNPVMLETNHPIMNIDYMAMKQYVKQQELSSNLLNKKTKTVRGSSEDMKYRKGRKTSYSGKFAAQNVDKTKKKDSHKVLKLGMYLDSTPRNTELNSVTGIEIVDKQLEKYSNKAPTSYEKRAFSKKLSKKPQAVFPQLNIKESNPPTPQRKLIQNTLTSSNRASSVQPRNFDNYQKKTLQSPSNNPPSSGHRFSIPAKRQSVDSNAQRRQSNAGSNYVEKNTRIISNLLKPIPRGSRNYIRSHALTGKNNTSNTRIYTNNSVNSARSEKSQDSRASTRSNKFNKSIRSNRGNTSVDNNSLIRELYRVRSSSSRSLDLKGDTEENPEEKTPDTKLSAKEEQSNGFSLAKQQLLNNKENTLNITRNESLASEPDHIYNYIRPGSRTSSRGMYPSAPNKKQRLNLATPARFLQNRNKIEMSFTQTSGFNASEKRNRSYMEKSGKEWNNYKKKIEHNQGTDSHVLQFCNTGSNSKGFAFERATRKGMFSRNAKTPGPGSYQNQIAKKHGGFSFGRQKKLDQDDLPIVEDMNKMFDPARNINFG